MSKVHPTRPLDTTWGRRRALKRWMVDGAPGWMLPWGGYDVSDSCDLETPVLCSLLRGHEMDWTRGQSSFALP